MSVMVAIPLNLVHFMLHMHKKREVESSVKGCFPIGRIVHEEWNFVLAHFNIHKPFSAL